MFDESSLMKGGGPAFYGMIRKVHAETKAVMILQNLDIDFATVELDVELDAGQRGKSTKAETKVLPKMRITYNTFDFIGPKGGPNGTPCRMVAEMVSEKSYQATIVRDKTKGESLFKSIFSIGKPDVNFDPFIVEMSKEDYKAAAKDMFGQYCKAFVATLSQAAKGK